MSDEGTGEANAFLRSQLQVQSARRAACERRLTQTQSELDDALQRISAVRVTLDAWTGSDVALTRFYLTVQMAVSQEPT